MSQIEIIFIRHGEAANRWGDHPDPGLSDKGKMQSNNLLKHKELQHLEKYSFLSSPKLRAIETAKPLAKKFNKEVMIDDTFIEQGTRDELLEITGLSVKSICKRIERYINE